MVFISRELEEETRMNRKTDLGIEAVSCLLARCGLQPSSHTSAMRIADAALLLDNPTVQVES